MSQTEATFTEPYLLVEKCGSQRGNPIYVITKYSPPTDGYLARTREIRCMDLGAEAFGTYKALQGGCSQIQFFNEVDDLKCTKCGQEFSKFYLRQSALIEVKGMPT